MESEQEHTALSWWLIECKVAYYLPDKVHPSRAADYEVLDCEYDLAEIRYLELCRELGCCNSIVHKAYPGFRDMTRKPHTPMLEVDLRRPSVQLVLAKLGSAKLSKAKKKRPRKSFDSDDWLEGG